MYETKAATQSTTVIAQLLAIAVIVGNMAGLNIGADVAGLTEKVGLAVDATVVLVLELVALWGRLRAKARITGLFRDKWA